MANPRLLQVLIQRLMGKGKLPSTGREAMEGPIRAFPDDPTFDPGNFLTDQQVKQRAMPNSFREEFAPDENVMMPPVRREASPEKLQREQLILDEIIKRVEGGVSEFGRQPPTTIGRKLPR